MSVKPCQSPSLWIVCSAFCSGLHRGKHRSSASLVLFRGIHQWPEDSLTKVRWYGERFYFMTSFCGKSFGLLRQIWAPNMFHTHQCTALTDLSSGNFRLESGLSVDISTKIHKNMSLFCNLYIFPCLVLITLKSLLDVFDIISIVLLPVWDVYWLVVSRSIF